MLNHIGCRPLALSTSSQTAIAPIPAPSALSDSHLTLATTLLIAEPHRAGITAAINRMSHNCDPLSPPIKVLIVEDEFILAIALQETLESLGYMVTGRAASFIETLRQIEQSRPDVVLMDIHLQGEQDGIETAIFLWDVFQLPVVYLSGLSDQSTLERAFASLPFGYLVKPARETDLATAINVAYQCCQAE